MGAHRKQHSIGSTGDHLPGATGCVVVTNSGATGIEEISVSATPAADTIPIADVSGYLDSWISGGVGGGGFSLSAEKGITAIGETQSDAIELTAAKSFIDVTGTAGPPYSGVRLMGASGDQLCIISNRGTCTINIYPGTGDDLGYGVDVPTTLTAGYNVMLTDVDDTDWISL